MVEVLNLNINRQHFIKYFFEKTGLNILCESFHGRDLLKKLEKNKLIVCLF